MGVDEEGGQDEGTDYNKQLVSILKVRKSVQGTRCENNEIGCEGPRKFESVLGWASAFESEYINSDKGDV